MESNGLDGYNCVAMILSLDNINAHSPYEVRNSPNGDFVFGTNLGIHYLISFEEEAPLGGCATFQFVIQKFMLNFAAVATK